MSQWKRRTFGSAFFLFLISCGEPPNKAARTLVRRYAQADCIPLNAVIRNFRIESIPPGTVKISDALTGRHVFVHATPTEIRTAPGGLTLFIREKSAITEYRLNPVQFQTRVEVLSEDFPAACEP